MSTVHRCPGCATPTEYAVLSGGKEWYCPACHADGSYEVKPRDARCQVFVAQPGTGGHMIQCVNPGTRHVFIAGCGCQGYEEVCATGADVWECAGPHDYGV